MFMHCCMDAVKLNREGYEVITTYREPHHTAASWFNRHGKWLAGRWRRQWVDYKLLQPSKVYQLEDLEFHENKFDDPFYLHRALKEGDMQYFYSKVPKECVDFALTPIEKLSHAKTQ